MDLGDEARASASLFLDMLDRRPTQKERVDLLFDFFQRAAQGGFDLGFKAGVYAQNGVVCVVETFQEDEKKGPVTHGKTVC